jgi:lactate permease
LGTMRGAVGALGIGTVVGADLSGTTFEELSDASALLSLPLFPVYAVAAVALAGGWPGIKRRGAEALLLGLVAGVGTLLTSLLIVPELSGALGDSQRRGYFSPSGDTGSVSSTSR